MMECITYLLRTFNECTRISVFRRLCLQELERRRLNGNCGACIHREECGGCRSRAYGFSGDYLGEDPVCGWWEEG